MKCKAERPWLPFANLWGPFSLPLPMASFFYQSVFLSTWRLSSSVSQSAAFNLWFFLSLSLEDNDFPFFSCKSWTLHFSNVQLEGFNPPRPFLFPGKLQRWLSICSFAYVQLCLCVCRSIYVPTRSLYNVGFEAIRDCFLLLPVHLQFPSVALEEAAQYLFISKHSKPLPDVV